MRDEEKSFALRSEESTRRNQHLLLLHLLLNLNRNFHLENILKRANVIVPFKQPKITNNKH
jgi:hypothetical protein